ALGVLPDVIDRVLHGTDLLGILVGDVDFEGFLEGENELDQPEGVGAQIVDERRFWLDVGFVDVELLGDDALDFRSDVAAFRHGFLLDETWPERDRSRLSPSPRPCYPIGAGFAPTINRSDVHPAVDRKSTRLNSSHVKISYDVFCLHK